MTELLKRLSGNRRPRWKVYLLNQSEIVLRELNVLEGSVKIAPFERLGGSASLVLDSMEDINYLSDRVRITYDPGIPGVDPWDIGTYLFASPKRTTDAIGRATNQVDLLPKLVVLDSLQLSSALALPTGANLIDSVLGLLSQTGEVISHVPSELAVREPMIFSAGENVLTVVNKLLTAANYWSIYATSSGVFALSPYVPPSERAPVWDFSPGEYSVMQCEQEYERDVASIPNRVIAHTSGTDEKPALVSVAENTNPDSPYSVSRRGRVISRSYQVDASDVSTLNSIAKRYLENAASPVAHWKISHGIVPLSGHDVVVLHHEGRLVNATVQEINMSLVWDSLAQTTLRQGELNDDNVD